MFSWSQSLSLSHQVWLIEVNVNPALHTNCATLQALVPSLLTETLGRPVLQYYNLEEGIIGTWGAVCFWIYSYYYYIL